MSDAPVWPNGAKCAVMLTFDFDAETLWISRNPDNWRRPGVLSQGTYGGKVAVPKILELLREKGCLGCHVLDGAGPPIGPPFDGMGARLNRNQIRERILDPNATVAPGYEQFAGMMPTNFGDQLTAAQLEIMVQFLAVRR